MRPTHALPALLVAAALAFAGCGGSGGSDDSGGSSSPPAASSDTTSTTPTTAAKPDGAEIFASAGCASCHTLAAANSKGVTGPNLDDLRPTLDQVKAQVTNGGGGMPPFSGDLSPEEIDAVAEYVSSSAGR